MKNGTRWVVCSVVILLGPLLFMGASSLLSYLPTLEAIVRVEDEMGNPLPGCRVIASFRHTDAQKERLGNWIKKFEGEYDGEHPVKFLYKSDYTIALEAGKEGYWNSGFRHDYMEKDRIDGGDGANGHYRREFIIVLRKKENPRPLFVNRVEWIEAPGYDESYGFDLETGDWVAPHGNGTFSDFIFTFNGDRNGKEEFLMEMKVTFVSEHDGVIEVLKTASSQSRLLLGSEAPKTDYKDEFVDFSGVKNMQGKLVGVSRRSQKEWAEIDGYWFRSRSEIDKETNEIRARYGKIIGHIRLSGRPEKPPKVAFTYYFAPDTSRSLEWDGESLVPKANLQGVKKH